MWHILNMAEAILKIAEVARFRTPFFLSFFFSYVAVMTIGLVVIFAIYLRTVEDERTQAVESARFMVSTGRDLIDARLEEIEDSGLSVAANRNIAEFGAVTTPVDTPVYFSLWRLRNEFRWFNLKTTFVDGAYIIFRRSGAVVSHQYCNPDIEWFYPNFLRYSELTFSEWSEAIDLWSGQTVFFPLYTIDTFDRKICALTMKIPLSSENAVQPFGALLILIPSRSIEQYYADPLRFGARLTIFDAGGRELYDSHPELSQPAEGLEVEAVSTVNGIRFRAVFPPEFITARTRQTRLVFLIALISMLLAGGVVAVFFAFRNSKPFTRLFRILTRAEEFDPADIRNQYSWLVDTMERLVGDQVSITNALERRTTMLMHGFYERLLRGGFTEDTQPEDVMEDAGVGFPPGPWHVAVVTVKDDQDATGRRVTEALVHDYFRRQIPADGYAHKTGEGDVLIMPYTTMNLTTISVMQRELSEQLEVITTAGIGKPRTTLLELCHSFDEAVQAIRVTDVNSLKPILVAYETGEDNPNSYTYTLQDEQMLMNAVASGDTEAMRSILGGIRAVNFSHNILPTTASACLLGDLISTAVKIVNSCVEDPHELELPADYIRHLERFTSAGDCFTRIGTILDTLCGYRNSIKKSHNEALSGEITAFIQEQYRDPLLCLASVAGRFGMNANYLSRFFKEQTGEPFSTYVEDLRMQDVLTEMAETKVPIRVIAERAGYQSWNSFYKAFRRRFGVSPGAYRDRITT